ncbi:MAG TPA: hypothetical protein VNR40_02920, partial [Steroidobacter sp.]|nr:hypothetical protein [Steroidobacter sp.]
MTVATLPLFLSLAGCGDSDRLEFPTFVSINVTGLSGTVELVLNGGESRRISSDGFFSFGTHRAASEVHAVTIRSQPAGQTCSVRNGPGPARSSSISIVVVTCVTNTYAIGGTVSGLDGSVELQNGSDV